MSMADNGSSYKRTHLFLIRVRCDNPDESDPADRDGNGERPALIWHGIVQKPASGEAHSFETKHELIEVLDAMICKERPEHSRLLGKPRSEDGLSASGNNQTEANEVHERNQ
ncbi:MAG: hypothetical protein ABIQ44_07935 [Chloroflexia bacterium]